MAKRWVALLFFSAVACAQQRWTTVLDGRAFANDAALTTQFVQGYPWGDDHNGTAKMLPAFAGTDGHGTLVLRAERVNESGTSSKPPHLPIRFHAGAVYWKHPITVDDAAPVWSVEGDFAVPGLPGTWPAFWLTAVHGWPPEIDILEYKGTQVVWQNTLRGHDYREAQFLSHKTEVSQPQQFHHYRALLTKLDQKNVRVQYFVDGKATGEDVAEDYAGKPFWLILNLQMEGAAPGTPPEHCLFRAKNIAVRYLSNSISPPIHSGRE